MCKRCDHDGYPYLAGKAVIFTLTPFNVIEDDVDGITKKREVDDPKPYTGICVRHHLNWVTIRTKSNSFSLHQNNVIAYFEGD